MSTCMSATSAVSINVGGLLVQAASPQVPAATERATRDPEHLAAALPADWTSVQQLSDASKATATSLLASALAQHWLKVREQVSQPVVSLYLLSHWAFSVARLLKPLRGMLHMSIAGHKSRSHQSQPRWAACASAS